MPDENFAEGKARVRNRLGFHARPAAAFVKLASEFEAEIQLTKDGLAVNGKSIMGVLMLAAERGSELAVRGEGRDAVEAVETLCSFIDAGFKEN